MSSTSLGIVVLLLLLPSADVQRTDGLHPHDGIVLTAILSDDDDDDDDDVLFLLLFSVLQNSSRPAHNVIQITRTEELEDESN